MSILGGGHWRGLVAEAGAILISFVVSYTNPEAAKDLFRGIDLYNLRQFNFWYYTQFVSFMIAFKSHAYNSAESAP